MKRRTVFSSCLTVKMLCSRLLGLISFLFIGANSLIIPEELPSLLSIIYSNIPPVKKGTDSRVGFGFRLGPHADFQVLLELGPQNNTNPIGPDATPPAKRQTLMMENPQKLVEYVNKLSGYTGQVTGASKPSKNKEVSNTAGGKWIDSWRNSLFGKGQIGKIQFNKVPGIDDLSAEGSDRIDMVWTDPTRHNSGLVSQLRKLYRAKTDET